VTPPSDFGVFKNVHANAQLIIYVVQAKVIKQHNTAGNMNIKCPPLATAQAFSHFKNSFTALSIVPWVKLSFAAFPRVQRYLRFWTIPVIDVEYFPRRSDQGTSIRVNLDVIFPC